MKKIIFIFLIFSFSVPIQATSPYQIGAYYFAMWNPTDIKELPALNELANSGCSRTYGRSNDPWCGVRDFFDGKNQGLSGDFSYLKPSIGYYDDSNPETYEKHIKQATQNGISYFAFYYYWDVTKHQENLKSSMDAFLMAKNKKDIKFVLSTHFIQSIPNSQFQEIATNMITRYFNQPNYLKLPNGQPILILSDTRTLGDDPGTAISIQSFLNILSTTSISKVGKTPYIVADPSSTPLELTYDGYTCRANAGLADTLYQPTDLVGDYNRYLTLAPNHNTYGKPFLTCAMDNFDERPRTQLTVPRGSARYTQGWSAERFKAILLKEKQFMDSRTDPLSKMLTIYAWNEWHEGGIIEPNIRDGAKLLNIISDVFDLPKGTDPCRITGKCDAVLGDINIDTKIDLYDFYLWKKESSGQLSTKKADLNHDGLVNTTDFDIWKIGYLN